MKKLNTKHQAEEYKELRAEIRHYLSRRQNNRNFAYLVTLGVLGSGYITSTQLPHETFILPPLLILSLWADEIGRLRAIQRLGTYIKVFIETEDTGYRYETLGLCPGREIAPISRFIANMDYPIIYSALAILCVFKYFEAGYIASCFLITLSFATLCIIIYKEAYTVAKTGTKNEESRWIKAKRDVDDQQKN